MSYEIKLDIFEGPLDLLLYLIRKNEIDIYNIPIALITEQYLEYLDMMRSLNLDLAGEYLVLAATLIHIKSKLLLPPAEGEEEEEEGEDPRAELVQQLLEYQAFKEAALSLETRPLLDRDVFTRGAPAEEPAAAEEEEEAMIEVGVFELVQAFRRIIAGLDRPGGSGDRHGEDVADRPDQRDHGAVVGRKAVDLSRICLEREPTESGSSTLFSRSWSS